MRRQAQTLIEICLLGTLVAIISVATWTILSKQKTDLVSLSKPTIGQDGGSAGSTSTTTTPATTEAGTDASAGSGSEKLPETAGTMSQTALWAKNITPENLAKLKAGDSTVQVTDGITKGSWAGLAIQSKKMAETEQGTRTPGEVKCVEVSDVRGGSYPSVGICYID